MVKIIAIGGGEIGGPKKAGGFFPVETSAIDKEILNQTSKKHPTLLFLPTASYDSPRYYEIVKKHFLHMGCSEVNPLYLSDKSLSPKQIESKILSHDAIYVGGGNSLRMMTTWRRLGVDKMLIKAAKQGVVMSGLSAGSICWFKYGNSDSRKFSSGSNELIKVTGLGLINALNCPHYDAEVHRQADLKRMMKSTPGVAIALENCSALEVIDNTYRIIKSKPSAKAYKVFWKSNKHSVEEIEASSELRPLKALIAK